MGSSYFNPIQGLFEPAEASAIPVSTLRERLSQYGVSQRHGPDSSAWNVIARSLAAGGNPVSRVVDSGVGNAGELLSYLRIPVHMGTVPLSLTQRSQDWTNVGAYACRSRRGQDRRHRHHPCRGRRACSSCDRKPWGLGYSGYVSVAKARQVIQDTWRAAVNTTRIGGPPGLTDTCAALDPALWFFGKYGCSHCENVVRQPVPISRACSHCQLRIST